MNLMLNFHFNKFVNLAREKENIMKTKKVFFRDILLLVALYANLIFGYFYVQTIEGEQKRIDIEIADLKHRVYK